MSAYIVIEWEAPDYDSGQQAATLAGDRGAEFDPLDGGRGQ